VITVSVCLHVCVCPSVREIGHLRNAFMDVDHLGEHVQRATLK